jgi:hypothetical protein
MNRFVFSGLYGSIALFFFLPFFNIKCNNSHVLSYSGKEIVFANKPAVNEELAEYLEDERFESAMGQMTQQKESVIVRVALSLSWALAIFSFLFLLIKEVSRRYHFIISPLIFLILALFAINAQYSFSRPEMKNMLFNISFHLDWGLILAFITCALIIGLNFIKPKQDDFLIIEDQNIEP